MKNKIVEGVGYEVNGTKQQTVPKLQKDEHGCVVGKELWDGEKCVPSPPQPAKTVMEASAIVHPATGLVTVIYKKDGYASLTFREAKMREGISKPRKQRPPPSKNLATDRKGVPNAPNILKGEILWRTDGSVLSKTVVNEARSMKGREPI